MQDVHIHLHTLERGLEDCVVIGQYIAFHLPNKITPKHISVGLELLSVTKVIIIVERVRRLPPEYW